LSVCMTCICPFVCLFFPTVNSAKWTNWSTCRLECTVSTGVGLNNHVGLLDGKVHFGGDQLPIENYREIRWYTRRKVCVTAAMRSFATISVATCPPLSCSLYVKTWAHANLPPNRVSIGSAVLQGSRSQPTHRQTQTDHATSSVAIGRIYAMHATRPDLRFLGVWRPVCLCVGDARPHALQKRPNRSRWRLQGQTRVGPSKRDGRGAHWRQLANMMGRLVRCGEAASGCHRYSNFS